MATRNIFDFTDVWNNVATSFRAIKVDVTDTTSAADSKLIELLKGGVAQFAVDKNGNLTLTGTVDGRDIAVDGGKLDGIEASADVTDATNVATAGAVMDSDITPAEGVLRKTGAGTYTAIKSNLGATTDPGVSDDNTAGYGVFSVWVNTTLDKVFICADTGTGAAVWREVGAGGINSVSEDTNPSLGGNLATGAFTVDGRDVSADGGKLDGIEAGADITDATNVDAAGAVMESDYNANTILAATTDNLPTPLTVGASTFVGRKSTGGISAMTPAEARTVLNVADGADVTNSTSVNTAGAVMHTDVSEAEGFIRKTGSETYVAVKTNLSASTAPGTGNDNTQGYAIGSLWIDTTLDKSYIAVDVSTGAAVWNDLTASAASGIASVSEDAAPALGGNLNVSGFSIVSTGNGDITIAPHNTGRAIIDGNSYPESLGTNGQVIQTNGSGDLTFGDAIMDGDFSAAEGVMRKSAAGTYTLMKSNLSGTAAPGGTDDTSAGYTIGSLWIDTTLDKSYICVDATATSAVWNDLTATAGGGATQLSELSDVTFGTLADAQIMIYDNALGDYENKAISGDITITKEGVASITTGAIVDADIAGGAAIQIGKLGSIADNVLIGRIEGTAGTPNIYGATSVRTLLNVADGANNYTHPNHTGDVTSTGDGATVIANNAVTLAKMADMATASFLGRNTAATGDPEVLSAATARTILNVADGANNYSHPNHTGDVTSTGDGATVIANSAVTNDKIANSTIALGKLNNIADDTILGNVSGGLSNPSALTATQVRTLLNVEDGADVTDATNVAAAGAVMDGDFASVIGAMRRTGAGTYSVLKDNLGAAVAPGTSDDSGAGYAVGSLWVDTTANKSYICVDATAAAAIWNDLTSAGAGDVTAGTHADNRVAVWNATANQIEGDANLTWTGTILGVSGDIDFTSAGSVLRAPQAVIELDGTAIGPRFRMTTAASGTGPVLEINGGATDEPLRIRSKGSSPIELLKDTNVTGNLGVSGTVDGRDVAADGTKLDGIDSGANAYAHPNHTGDVTSTGDGATVIANNAVTLAKMADMATASFIGRNTAATGDPEVLSATTARSILNVADGANNYSHPNHTGDVTSTGDGATVIANNAVTLAKMADMATSSILGRATAATGDPEVLTAAQVRTIINVEDGADVTDATNVAAAGAIMDGDFSTNGLMKRTAAGVYATAVAGTDYEAVDADILRADVGDTLNAGYLSGSYSRGTISSGTVTPAPATGEENFQHYTNNGAHTLAPPASPCTVVIEITNAASAGAITTSGFTIVDGDAFTTTSGHDFHCFITKTNSFSSLTVKALQ